MNCFKIKPKCAFYNYRPRIPIKKIYWEFRKGDDDYRPCVPHGHSLDGDKADGKYKLELWTGNIYEEGTQILHGVAKKKDMLLLFNNTEFRRFVDNCRELYQQKNPKFKLPPLKNNFSYKIARYLTKNIARSSMSKQTCNIEKMVIPLEYTEIIRVKRK